MISASHRFVFVHIPRTGGSSVETALRDFSDSPVGIAANQSTVVEDKHITAARLQERLGSAWKSHFSFSFVRNPWQRMLSDYFFFQKVAPQLFNESDGYIWTLTESSARLPFNHWLVANAPILEICQLGYLTDAAGTQLVDFIGRFENLVQDFATVCAHIGVDRSLPHVNGTTHRPYRDYYDPRGAEVVATHAQPDIARFGYTF